jgi:hypothetical protein
MNPTRSGLWAGAVVLLVAGFSPLAQAQEQPAPGAGGQPAAGQPAAQPTTAPATPPALVNLPGPPPIRRGRPISVMAYPFTNLNTNAMTQALGDRAADRAFTTIKGGMIFSQQYDVTTYSPRAALVHKAELDTIIDTAALGRLYDATTHELVVPEARGLAQLLRVQSVLVGTLESVEVNRTANSATVTITAQLLDSVTGAPIKSAAVSGAATGAEDDSALDLVVMAADDAAAKALAEFGIALVGAADKEGKEEGGLPDKIGSAPESAANHAPLDWLAEHGIAEWKALAGYMLLMTVPFIEHHAPQHHLP